MRILVGKPSVQILSFLLLSRSGAQFDNAPPVGVIPRPAASRFRAVGAVARTTDFSFLEYRAGLWRVYVEMLRPPVPAAILGENARQPPDWASILTVQPPQCGGDFPLNLLGALHVWKVTAHLDYARV
jgi:hypothetical protein